MSVTKLLDIIDGLYLELVYNVRLLRYARSETSH